MPPQTKYLIIDTINEHKKLGNTGLFSVMRNIEHRLGRCFLCFLHPYRVCYKKGLEIKTPVRVKK